VRPGAPPRRNRAARVVVSCKADAGRDSLSAGMGAASPEALLAASPSEHLARRLGRMAQDRSEGRGVPPGRWPIILSRGSGGVFFHEACGHALEADLVLRSASPFRGQLGARIAPGFVGALDDPTQPDLEGSYAWDDEGVSGRGTVLIDKGILRS